MIQAAKLQGAPVQFETVLGELRFTKSNAADVLVQNQIAILHPSGNGAGKRMGKSPPEAWPEVPQGDNLLLRLRRSLAGFECYLFLRQHPNPIPKFNLE